MARIGIDARFIVQPRRGIGTYSLALMRELVAAAQDREFVLYIDRPDSEGLLPNGPHVAVRQLDMRSYPLWEQFALPAACSRDRIDLLHCLGNTAPLRGLGRCRLVLSLMDVMFLQSNELIPMPTSAYQRLGRSYRAFVSPRAARNAARVLTISEFSRRDILDCIPDLDASKVRVTWLSCSDEYVAAGHDAPDAGGDYLLCLGAEDPRKNTVRIVKAFIAMKQRGVASAAKLVICGYKGWIDSPAYREVQLAGALDSVEFHEFVTTQRLKTLYQGAVGLVYPSLYEGFGIPIVEAFRCGCPVITSKVTSMPEIGGNAALYVDPCDEHGIGHAMERLLTEPGLRASLAAKGRDRAPLFDWQTTARQTLAIYDEVLGTPQGAAQ